MDTGTVENTEAVEATGGGALWELLRIAMGWIFFWGVLDKLLALGFATGRDPEAGEVDRFDPET